MHLLLSGHRLTFSLFWFIAGLRTTAELSEDGSHYIVNGTKKWISNAIWSDYIVTGCRTKNGFTVLLVPKQEGVTTKSIKTSYSAAAATSFIEFDNVKVPAKNLLGEVDKGFIVIMSNFNHERWYGNSQRFPDLR